MLAEYLKDNNLIITPSSFKKKVVVEINNMDKLISYKVMTLKEFMDNYAYSYNKATIYYIMKKLDASYEIALEYLANLYYVEDKEYTSYKLNELVSLKKELSEQGLINNNPVFIDSLNRTNIIIYGYDLDPFYKNIFSKYNYQIVKEAKTLKKLSAFEFTEINDEINYLAYDIKNKILAGTDINNIKIVDSGEEYLLPLKRIFTWANIPLNLNERVSLYDLEVGKKILSYLNDDLSFSDIIEKLKDIDSDILNKFINVFNEYSIYDIEKAYLIKMITYDLKNTYLPSKKLDNAVSLCSIDEVSKEDIVYLVGFNKENYPRVNKDEDFLSDNMKLEVGLFTSNELNIHNTQALINKLYSSINYIISYKLRDSFNDYNPSILIEELNMDVIKDIEIAYDFSNFFNKINLAIGLDNYRKYGIINDNLRRLAVTYDIPYNTYNNKFTGLDNKYFLSSLNKLGLSYTKIDNYFKCKFKYYLSYILKAQLTNSDNFIFDIGNIFHYVLSKYNTKDFDFDRLWDEASCECSFTKGQLVLINNLKDELKYDLNIIKKQEAFSKIDKHLFEKDVTVDIDNNKFSKIYFNGKIDKIIYGLDEDTNNTIVSVVDYKTGTLPKDFSDINYGMGMQLPVYLYLVKNSKLFTNPVIAGFYLQKIINKDSLREFGKDMALEKEKKLKLFGYSNSSNSIISKFDNSYTSSKYISGLGVKDGGEFYARSKVMSSTDIDKLINFVDAKIKEAANGIIAGDFEINPKRKPKDNVCSMCIYKDICYRREEDYADLEPQKEFSFLGGDDNA